MWIKFFTFLLSAVLWRRAWYSHWQSRQCGSENFVIFPLLISLHLIQDLTVDNKVTLEFVGQHWILLYSELFYLTSSGVYNNKVHLMYHHLDTYLKRMHSLYCAKVCNCSVDLPLMQTELRTVIDFWFPFLTLKICSTVSFQKKHLTMCLYLGYFSLFWDWKSFY